MTMKNWIIATVCGVLVGILTPIVAEASSEHQHESPSFVQPKKPLKGEKSQLQKLIDRTEPGGTLFLEKRVYRGSLSITKPITIIGMDDTKIHSLTTALTVSDTQNVVLENISFQAENTAIVVSNVQNIHLKNVGIGDSMAGIQITKSENISLHDVDVLGKEGHFSSKGHAVAIYESKKITATDNDIEQVLDGFYLESVEDIHLTNNSIKNSRYAMHMMYSNHIELANNNLFNNMTGFMVMIAKDVQISDNMVAKNNMLNSLGVYVYDVENVLFEDNELRENTTAMDIQNARDITVEKNVFLVNGTVLHVQRSQELFVQQNEFHGNILTVRTDQQGFSLKRNYYDDYEGKDYNGDQIGDTQYIATNSFGQWMVRKPVYQYFMESPSVMTLNMMDTEVTENNTQVVVDEYPIILKKPFSLEIDIHIWQLLISSILLISMLIIRRRLK